MIRVRFKMNDMLLPPYHYPDGGILFSEFNEVQELDESIAARLVTDFPFAFEAEGELPPFPSPFPNSDEAEPDTAIKLRFIATPTLPTYHSASTSFEEDGQVQALDAGEAQRLVTEFPDNFEVVELSQPEPVKPDSLLEAEETAEGAKVSSEPEDAFLVQVQEALKREGKPLTAGEIASALEVKPVAIYRKLASYVERGMLHRKEGEAGKLYSLPE